MVPVIWLALIGAIYSRIAPIFALNRIFFPANKQATLKTKQPIRFQGLFKATNQITGIWKTKSIMWQTLQLLFPKLLFPPPLTPPPNKKMDEFNIKLSQYCINKIFELTKSCIWSISANCFLCYRAPIHNYTSQSSYVKLVLLSRSWKRKNVIFLLILMRSERDGVSLQVSSTKSWPERDEDSFL